MNSIASPRFVALATTLVCLSLIIASTAYAVTATPEELARSHRWVENALSGTQPTNLPFSFNYNGKTSAELLPTWSLGRSSNKLDDQRMQHSLILTDPQTGLQVRCAAIEYHDFPIVEWTLYFKNTGSNPTPLLSEILALDTRLAPTGSKSFLLHHNTGDTCAPDSYEPHELTLTPKSDQRFAPAGGRPTSFGFPYFNLASSGEGVIAVIGWPGQWAARFTGEATNTVRLRAGQELTHLKLERGEEIRTPLIALEFYQGDVHHSQNLWRRWMRAHNSPRTADGKLPPPILSSCGGGFFPGIQCTEATERQFITAFARAGVKLDYWWLDAGWYPCDGNWPKVGTWTPDLSRFPRGLKAVSEFAHTNAMGFIVWFEPERVTPGTWLYTNNPSWLLGPDGDQKLLNVGNPAARQWLTDHLDKLLTEQGIDFYRQDFNIDPLPFWRANDRPDRQGMTEIRHVEGYLAYWDELRQRHPGLLIDSCASGGRRNDLETLRRAIPLLRSDYQAFDGNPAYAPGNQGHTYGLSAWIPYFGQGVYYSDRQFLYSAHSYLSPAFGVAVDVRKPDIDWALIRKVVDQWRRLAPCYSGDFYPLLPYRLSENDWLAWQFDLPETGEGMVQIFRRADSPYEAARLKLKGLKPAANYRVTNLDTSNATQASGQELTDKGYSISLPARPSSAILIYQQIN